MEENLVCEKICDCDGVVHQQESVSEGERQDRVRDWHEEHRMDK